MKKEEKMRQVELSHLRSPLDFEDEPIFLEYLELRKRYIIEEIKTFAIAKGITPVELLKQMKEKANR